MAQIGPQPLAPWAVGEGRGDGWRPSECPRGRAAIRPPLLRRPRTHLPLQRIDKAWADKVRPLPDLGGREYRIANGRRGLALRSGQAVWLELDDGKQFVVAVDDAATAAGLLGDLLARDVRRDH